MVIGIWTLVEAEGSVDTVIARNIRRGIAVDKKAELMIELKSSMPETIQTASGRKQA